MELFKEYPRLENEQVLLRRMTIDDAPALQAFKENKETSRYLPTFLYEQKYEDAREVIERMDEECFQTKEAILLAVCRKKEPDLLVGIAEIYHYEENKEKASIGCRLDSSVWGNGIGTQVIALLKDYLLREVGLRTVTAHVMRDNAASARAAVKNGFVQKYPDIYEDWGFDQMAYMEQDRIRAMLPEGFESLRPVLRINTEIRDERAVYAELNTPVEAEGRRGWLNIANWKSTSGDDISFRREDATVTIASPFLELAYTGTGKRGGCPAEKDNEGCYYLGNDKEFRPVERIDREKEFCDCHFAWHFHEGDAAGASTGRTLPAAFQPLQNEYEHCALTAENAAKIPCRQVLGAYIVRFERYRGTGEKL